MFLHRVQQAVRFFPAGRLIGEGVRRFHGCDCHPHQEAVLAHVSLDHIAAVVVFGHIDRLPDDNHRVTFPNSADALGWAVKDGLRQTHGRNPQCHYIAVDFDHRSGDPTLILNLVRLDPQPAARVIPAPHGAGITGIHPPGIQVSLARSVTAVCLHKYSDGREAVGRCGCNGWGKGLGRGWCFGGCERGGESRRGRGSSCVGRSMR